MKSRLVTTLIPILFFSVNTFAVRGETKNSTVEITITTDGQKLSDDQVTKLKQAILDKLNRKHSVLDDERVAQTPQSGGTIKLDKREWDGTFNSKDGGTSKRPETGGTIKLDKREWDGTFNGSGSGGTKKAEPPRPKFERVTKDHNPYAPSDPLPPLSGRGANFKPKTYDED